MKKLLKYILVFFGGVVAALVALCKVFCGPDSHAENRYMKQKEIEDEIKRKSEVKAENTHAKVMAFDPADVLASLPTETRERIDAIRKSATRRALDTARKRSRAHTDGGGAGGDNPGSP